MKLSEKIIECLNDALASLREDPHPDIPYSDIADEIITAIERYCGDLEYKKKSTVTLAQASEFVRSFIDGDE